MKNALHFLRFFPKFFSPWSMVLLVSAALLLAGCGNSGLRSLSAGSLTSASSLPSTVLTAPNANDPNVVALTVGNCGAGTYMNEPCVSVTICQPGTNTCQTIPNILLDTGSYGLRVFKSVVSLSLTQEVVAGTGKGLAECAMYGDGSEQWGPVVTADIQLGQRKATNVPIEIIDATYGSLPTICAHPEASPTDANFNGIMGIGLIAQDCGATCTTNASRSNYYACTGAQCAQSTVTLAQQVTNPVALLNRDNNGTVLMLPAISAAGGTPAVTGFLVLGVGTESNNTLNAPHVLAADANAQFTTTWAGQSVPAFIDSGSNGFFFPGSAALPTCSGSTFFCPNSLYSGSAIMQAAFGAATAAINFQIYSANAIPASSGAVATVGAQSAGMFDWGLPFFFGKSVATVIQGAATASPAGVGPYWGF